MSFKRNDGSDLQDAIIKSLKRELAATRAELSSHIDAEERAKDSLHLSEDECKRLHERIKLLEAHEPGRCG